MKEPTLDFAEITAKRTLLLRLDYDNLIDYITRNPDILSDRQKDSIIDMYSSILRNTFVLEDLKRGIVR